MTQTYWCKYCKHLFLILNLLISTSVLWSQTWVELQSKYPGYNEYIIQETQSYSIGIEKNKLKILSDNYYESVILSDLGIHNNQESLIYSQIVPIKSYEAYSVVNQNGKERKIPVAKVVDLSLNQRNVFHSDAKEKKLTYSGLHVGAKKVYKYQNEFSDPFLLHKFIFNNEFPAGEYKLEVLADKNVKIGYKVFNDPNNLIQFSKTDQKGKNLYSWTLKNSLPLRYEERTPGYLYSVAHIVLYVENYTAKNEIHPVLGTVDLLYNYYKNFTKDLNLFEDENLKKTTLSLVENLSTDEEKMKAIYYWVQDNIKYVAFEEAYEGFIPREAKLVYERKFGDCKDMSSIITEMAKYAQIPNVNLTWIGSRSIPYTYHEVPTPAVDNHMIATYETNGEIIFLDATDSFTAFGLPSSFIQGKEAMIQNGETYQLVTVPVVSSQENLVETQIEIQLENTLLKGKAQSTFKGLARSEIVSIIGERQNIKRHEIMKALLELGNNKFHLVDFHEINFSNKDLPYEIDFQFELDNYAISVGDETYLNMFLEKPYEKVIIADDREAILDFEFLEEKQYSVILEIPKDTQVTFYPKDVEVSNSLLDYSIKYKLTENQLKLDFQIKLKKLMLQKEDFNLWKTTINSLKSHYNESIIISKK